MFRRGRTFNSTQSNKISRAIRGSKKFDNSQATKITSFFSFINDDIEKEKEEDGKKIEKIKIGEREKRKEKKKLPAAAGKKRALDEVSSDEFEPNSSDDEDDYIQIKEDSDFYDANDELNADISIDVPAQKKVVGSAQHSSSSSHATLPEGTPAASIARSADELKNSLPFGNSGLSVDGISDGEGHRVEDMRVQELRERVTSSFSPLLSLEVQLRVDWLHPRALAIYDFLEHLDHIWPTIRFRDTSMALLHHRNAIYERPIRDVSFARAHAQQLMQIDAKTKIVLETDNWYLSTKGNGAQVPNDDEDSFFPTKGSSAGEFGHQVGNSMLDDNAVIIRIEAVRLFEGVHKNGPGGGCFEPTRRCESISYQRMLEILLDNNHLELFDGVMFCGKQASQLGSLIANHTRVSLSHVESAAPEWFQGSLPGTLLRLGAPARSIPLLLGAPALTAGALTAKPVERYVAMRQHLYDWLGDVVGIDLFSFAQLTPDQIDFWGGFHSGLGQLSASIIPDDADEEERAFGHHRLASGKPPAIYQRRGGIASARAMPADADEPERDFAQRQVARGLLPAVNQRRAAIASARAIPADADDEELDFAKRQLDRGRLPAIIQRRGAIAYSKSASGRANAAANGVRFARVTAAVYAESQKLNEIFFLAALQNRGVIAWVKDRNGDNERLYKITLLIGKTSSGKNKRIQFRYRDTTTLKYLYLDPDHAHEFCMVLPAKFITDNGTDGALIRKGAKINEIMAKMSSKWRKETIESLKLRGRAKLASVEKKAARQSKFAKMSKQN